MPKILLIFSTVSGFPLIAGFTLIPKMRPNTEFRVSCITLCKLGICHLQFIHEGLFLLLSTSQVDVSHDNSSLVFSLQIINIF